VHLPEPAAIAFDEIPDDPVEDSAKSSAEAVSASN